jgi:hypothetical protein
MRRVPSVMAGNLNAQIPAKPAPPVTVDSQTRQPCACSSVERAPPGGFKYTTQYTPETLVFVIVKPLSRDYNTTYTIWLEYRKIRQ